MTIQVRGCRKPLCRFPPLPLEDTLANEIIQHLETCLQDADDPAEYETTKGAEIAERPDFHSRQGRDSLRLFPVCCLRGEFRVRRSRFPLRSRRS